MEFLNQQYAIVGQYRSNSNTGAGRMTTITMRGITDNKTYTTYVVDKYKNYRLWKTIVMNPNTGYIVTFNNGKLSKPYQIDADSQPDMVATASTKDLNDTIDQLHGIKERRRKPTKQEVLEQIAKVNQMVQDLFE